MSVENGFGVKTRMALADRSPGQVGFGTSHLAGRLGRKESGRILDAAFAAGIRHFDTAAMYGYGGAEEVVGEFLRDKRDQVTVTTKFGIDPPKASPIMTLAKAAAKVVVSFAPSLRSRVAKRAGSMVSTGNFTVAHTMMSLNRSLTALRTTHIDMFLMHDVLPEQVSPELLEFLERATAEGKIRRYGATFVASEIGRVGELGQTFGNVVQVPDDAVDSARQLLGPEGLCITHSVFRSRLKPFYEALKSDAAFAKRCSDALGIDCLESKRLGRLFLRGALERNRGGFVLFSSINEKAIRENAAVGTGREFTSTQMDTLGQLASEISTRNPASNGDNS